MEHLKNYIKHGELRSDNTLHVIGVIENPMRYQSRYRIFQQWYKAMLATPNVKVYIVECSYGDRHFEVTDPNNPQHLQLYSTQPIWHKENLINLGVEKLFPSDWKYMSWCDCDVFFNKTDWALETIHRMQDYCVVQSWSDCLDLGFNGRVLQHFKSFCYQHQLGVPKQTHPSQPYQYAHTGYQFAYRRDFWEAVGGLIDFCILGSCDHHTAFALINEVDKTIHNGMTKDFFRGWDDWEFKAYRHTNGQLGYVPGFITHSFHGKKVNRQYRERWQILIEDNFDPLTNLCHDTQGLIKVIGNPKLLEDCRTYMRERQEDSIDEY